MISLSSLTLRARALFARARDERASPRQVGLAVAVGVFIGASPAVGIHGSVAVVAATLFRLNRLWAFLGSRVSNVVVLPWLVFAEVQVGHLARTGARVPYGVREVLQHKGELLLDWALGSVPVGAALAFALGFAAFALTRRRRARPPAPSSGSPP